MSWVPAPFIQPVPIGGMPVNAAINVTQPGRYLVEMSITVQTYGTSSCNTQAGRWRLWIQQGQTANSPTPQKIAGATHYAGQGYVLTATYPDNEFTLSYSGILFVKPADVPTTWTVWYRGPTNIAGFGGCSNNTFTEPIFKTSFSGSGPDPVGNIPLSTMMVQRLADF